MEKRLCQDFELRGLVYEIWNSVDGRYLVDPRSREVVNTDCAFSPPLTNDELLSVYDYGRDF